MEQDQSQTKVETWYCFLKKYIILANFEVPYRNISSESWYSFWSV